MLTRIALVASCLLSFVAVNRSEAQTRLSVVSARPAGETSDLGESREITVVFSEPMVALGRIPNPVTAPFFKIQPAIAGTFRWSGTSILIFTPDPKVALPFSTRYTVTIDATATAISGRTLAAPYTVFFTTPTVKLLATNWYRRGNRFDGPVVLGLRFNQPVRAADLLQRLALAYKTHDWTPPAMSAAARARMQATEPAGLAAFEAKVAAATAAANSTAARRGVLDRDVGPEPAGQAGTDPGRAADHDGAADRELDRAHRPHRGARCPGQRADAAAADLHHGARADVLRRRAAVPDPVRSRSLEPVAPAPRGADGERPQGVLADRRHHRDGQAAGPQAGPRRRWRLGPQRGLHARGSRLRRAEAGEQVRAAARTDAAGDRWPDPRLSLDRRGRELAHDGVHQLRRRPRRVGVDRRHGAAVLRAQLHDGEAVGRGRRPARAAADDPGAPVERLPRPRPSRRRRTGS